MKKKRKQITAAIPDKVDKMLMKVLPKTPYTTRNGFVVAAVIKEVERCRRKR